MLNIMTLNVANYDGHPHWLQRRDLAVQAILDARADVVALQEMRFNPAEPTTRDSYQNMGEQILYGLNQQGEHCGSAIVTQPAMYYSGDGPMAWYPLPGNPSQLWEGLSIISSLPVIETGALFHTRPAESSDNNLRATQYAALQWSGETIYLFNTHFALDNPGRMANARDSLAYMERMARGPALLVGDMNARPEEPSMQLLHEGGLTDLWERQRPGEAGLTFPSARPEWRIDYFWASDAMVPLVRGIEPAATRSQDGIFASDHRGLTVTLVR